jgi:hypothetical protein
MEGHAEHMGALDNGRMQNVESKPDWKRQRGKLSRWEDNIKVDVKEIVCEYVE